MSGQRHLVPYFRYRAGVDPLVAARTTVIVKVVIDSCAAAAPSLIGCRQPPHITPVVLRPEQGDVVRDPHAFVIVILYLLVKAPHLGYLSDVRSNLFSDDASLKVHYLFQPVFICRRSSRSHLRIVSTAQSYGDDTFKIPVAPDTVAPEFQQRIGVVSPAPVAQAVFISSVPLFLCPDHRFLVAGAHDDAILIGQRSIAGVILVEGVVPHCRPEVVGLQPQQQLEYP